MLKNKLSLIASFLFEKKLDKNELDFLEKKRFFQKSNDEMIIVEIQENYFYLKLIEQLIIQKKIDNIVGIYTNKFYYRLSEIVLIFPLIVRLLIYHKRRKKYKILYKSIGVKNFFEYKDVNILHKVKNFITSFKVFFLKKEELAETFVCDFKIGDLVLDTYYRYYNKPTLSKSFKSYFIYLRALNSVSLASIILKQGNFNKVFFEFSCYVHHGIFVRFFTKSKKQVYISGTEQKLFKLIDINHPYDSINFKIFKKKINTISDYDRYLKLAKKNLEDRFSGKPDMDYMFKSSYININKDFEQNLSGVVFLHDFFDCVHLYGELVFEDFYEWTIFLIKLTLKYNLKIGFKPHPLERPESKKITNKLIKRYPQISWIDERINNKSIFNSGIKFGVSVYGTVLSELAYHKIIPISCGENPTSPFNFTFEAKSPYELENYILNHNKLKLIKNVKEQIFSYYINNYLTQNSDIDLRINSMILKSRFYDNDSKILKIK